MDSVLWINSYVYLLSCQWILWTKWIKIELKLSRSFWETLSLKLSNLCDKFLKKCEKIDKRAIKISIFEKT